MVISGPTGTGGCLGEVRRFDASGAPTGGVGTVGCSTVGAGVSTRGEAIVLELWSPGAGLIVHWIRPDGTSAVACGWRSWPRLLAAP